MRTILLAFAIFGVFFLFLTGRMRTNSEDFFSIDDRISVDVIRADGTVEHYDNGTVEAIHKGDSFVIQTDEITGIKPGSAIVFSIYNSSISVYSNHRLLYEDDDSARAESEEIGDRWYSVSLPDWQSEQVIRIEGTMERNGSISLFSNFEILPAASSWKSILLGNEFMFLVFTALDVLSCVFLAFFFLSSIKEKKIQMGFWISLFAIVICNWYLGYKLFYYVISDDANLNANIEYVSFFSIGTPLAFFMYHHLTKPIYKKISFVFGILFTIVLAVSTIINYSPIIMNYCDLLPYCRILLGISLLFFGYAVFSDQDRETREDALANNIIKLGVIVAIGVGVLSLLQAQLNAADVTQRLKGDRVDLIPLAILIMVITLYISVISRYAQDTVTKMEAEQLKTIAFIDPLTGAENCSALYSHLNELMMRGRQDYVMIFLDVNNLKDTNDRYGHEVGDQLISYAANLVRQSFQEGEHGFTGRWGGDEFIACVFGSEEDAKSCIRKFYQNLDEFNETGKLPFHMSVSSGYAVSTSQHPVDYETAIRLADQSMYQDKKAYKEAHGLA